MARSQSPMFLATLFRQLEALGHIQTLWTCTDASKTTGKYWNLTNFVTELFFRYRIVYLSSRAIGRSYQTKRYLSSIIQDSKTLPDGPVLLSPTSVLMAFRK